MSESKETQFAVIKFDSAGKSILQIWQFDAREDARVFVRKAKKTKQYLKKRAWHRPVYKIKPMTRGPNA